jgi:hypothetical protein
MLAMPIITLYRLWYPYSVGETRGWWGLIPMHGVHSTTQVHPVDHTSINEALKYIILHLTPARDKHRLPEDVSAGVGF